MQGVKEDSIDQEFLTSETFIDLVLNAVDTAARTRDREKIRLVAQILRGAIVEGERGDYSPEEYLHLISDLTPQELKVAFVFHNTKELGQETQKDDDSDYDSWRRHLDHLGERLDMEQDDLLFILKRLSSAGVLLEVGHNFPGTIPNSYLVAAAFEKLIEFVRRDE